MLDIGTKAPDFTLPDQNGELHSLTDYRGQKVGERVPQFGEKGAVVIGVSRDTVASHKKFAEKYGLPFPLLSDSDKTVLQAYDVWKEKKACGKVSMGVVRTTYLIDENGVIVQAMDKVKAAENPAQMLDALS